MASILAPNTIQPRDQQEAENPWGSFSSEQGKAYSRNRRSYAPKLYEIVLNFHRSTGGRLQSLVDVGCGPGVAVRDLGRYFETAIGLDASQGMIDTARSIGGSAASGPIQYTLSKAEDMNDLLPHGTVDLIIAANSAHYFDHARFWAAAASVLKPGGSVAMWASRPVGIHHSVPNAAAIEEALNLMQQAEVEQYEKFKADEDEDCCSLSLPWQENIGITDFDESTFYRKRWPGQGGNDNDDFFISQPRFDLDTMEQIMSATAGPYLEWRKSHPDIAGTEQDLLRRSRREIERLQRAVGVEEGREWIKSSVAGILLIVKKKN